MRIIRCCDGFDDVIALGAFDRRHGEQIGHRCVGGPGGWEKNALMSGVGHVHGDRLEDVQMVLEFFVGHV